MHVWNLLWMVQIVEITCQVLLNNLSRDGSKSLTSSAHTARDLPTVPTRVSVLQVHIHCNRLKQRGGGQSQAIFPRDYKIRCWRVLPNLKYPSEDSSTHGCKGDNEKWRDRGRTCPNQQLIVLVNWTNNQLIMPACLAAYWKASPRLGAVVKRGIKDMLTQGRGENVLLGPPMLE